MSPRRRLGVALLVEAPHAAEIDGLRRAVGDRALARIPPHVTLVPPVNVAERDLGAALAVVRAAAAGAGRPLELTFGPPGTFLSINPVLYLQVGGELDRLRELHDAVGAGPLHRPSAWPWVPHVTLADGLDPARIHAALGVLGDYVVQARVGRVVVLEERHGDEAGIPTRRWEPCADIDLAQPAVIGRGGIELTLVQGSLVDPVAAQLLGAGAGAGAGSEVGVGVGVGAPIVLSALIDGKSVGVARAWRSDAGGHIGVLVAPGRRRQGIGRHLLARTEDAVRAAGWDCPVLRAAGPAGFYAACSSWSVAP